jgi:hypothetical protein
MNIEYLNGLLIILYIQRVIVFETIVLAVCTICLKHFLKRINKLL